ncbi:MAG: MFS transporter [Acidobacteria bacterium 13_1_40CM_4_65_8]|nr:MAG: MFS transporter [Acidobacteria bacterium 13_1_40CM_4_65_8]
MRREPTVGIVLAGSAAFLNLYSTQPLLPLLARTFRASTFDVGLTITAPAIAVAISAPMIGRLADRAGLRRVIVSSAFLLAIATALAASAASLRQLIFWRLVQGLMTPGIFAGTIAYIHEEWPASRAGRATAAYMTGTIIGGFTGRAVAGLVAADVDWHASFVALAVLSVALAVALLAWLPPERTRTHAHADHARGSSLVEHLRNRQLLATYAIGFCVLFTQVAMFTYVTFHLAAPPFHLSTAALGWLFAVYLVGAVVTPFGGTWIDRYGHRVGLGIAMAIGAAGALLTLVPSLPVVAAGLALSSTGVFVAQASTSSYIGAVTTRDRALAVGMYSTFYYIGGSVGGALPSLLWNAGGWSACVALIVTVQMTGVAIALTFWRGSPQGLRYEPEPEAVP